MEHINPDLDAGIVGQVARYECLLSLVWDWLGKHGVFTPDGEPQPVLKTMAGSFENALTMAYEKLGLTPESRKRLRITSGDVSWAKKLAAVDRK